MLFDRKLCHLTREHDPDIVGQRRLQGQLQWMSPSFRSKRLRPPTRTGNCRECKLHIFVGVHGTVTWRLLCVPCSMLWCGVVWCGLVWCVVVWCGLVWYSYGVVWCGVAWYGVEWCAVVRCGVVCRGVHGMVWYGASPHLRRAMWRSVDYSTAEAIPEIAIVQYLWATKLSWAVLCNSSRQNT